jgi:HK97 gp10 family phage protein
MTSPRIDLQLTGADDILAKLKSLPAEMVSKRGGPVLAGLRKGARLIRNQAAENLQAQMSGDESTGLLLKSLIVTRGKAPFGTKGERVLVRVKRRVYPGTGKGTGVRAVTTIAVAHLFEYGSKHQPPRSFIVSAFKARASEAISTAVKEVSRGIDRITKRMAKSGVPR